MNRSSPRRPLPLHLPCDSLRPPRRAFTLIELLTVIAIIGVVVGIALPSLQKARLAAVKTACLSNLKNLGHAIEMYKGNSSNRYPLARYMPLPFLSASTAPPITDALSSFLGGDKKVFRCPGDSDHVFTLAGCSYYYNTFLAGQTPENTPAVTRLNLTPSQIPIMYDMDSGVFELMEGVLAVPPFHDLRNLLFADGHAGNFD
jgi:prepilin-type N-terminal cleavage/methylation domain-containing protein/prepilin-type processing-associated H-X9-DG protein